MKVKQTVQILLSTVVISSIAISNGHQASAKSTLIPNKSICYAPDHTQHNGFPYTVGQLKAQMEKLQNDLGIVIPETKFTKVIVTTTDDSDYTKTGKYTIELDGSFNSNRQHDSLIGAPIKAVFTASDAPTITIKRNTCHHNKPWVVIDK